MYFYYGITNSSLENPTEEIELTVDQSFVTPEKVMKQIIILSKVNLTKKKSSLTLGDQRKKQFGKINGTVTRTKWLKKNGQRMEKLVVGARITTPTLVGMNRTQR